MVKSTPLARAVAADLGVDLVTVTGSGRGGRITRADVEAAATPSGSVDNAALLPTGSATLPHRGPEPGAGSLQAAPTPAGRGPQNREGSRPGQGGLRAVHSPRRHSPRRGGGGLDVGDPDQAVGA